MSGGCDADDVPAFVIRARTATHADRPEPRPNRARRSHLPLWPVLAIVGGAIDPALACRCAPQPLADYFARAEVVFIGRVTSTAVEKEPPAYRSVRFELHGKPYKGDPAALTHFATPLSSATCGYEVAPGRLYLVFASRHAPEDRIAWFDTCNGTREFDPRGPAGVQGFTDVPAKEVPVAGGRLPPAGAAARGRPRAARHRDRRRNGRRQPVAARRAARGEPL
jgi:hypothetical protein